jgi:hypothetical protein
MAAKKKPSTEETINVLDVQHGRIDVHVVGVGDPPGLMHNCFSNKVAQALLYPSGRKTTIVFTVSRRESSIHETPFIERRRTSASNHVITVRSR